jgi:hypothetical protein
MDIATVGGRLTIESVGNKENLARQVYLIKYRVFAATGHPIGL